MRADASEPREAQPLPIKWRRHPAFRGNRISADGWALLAVAAVIICANLPYLLGLFDGNPLGPRSGLTSTSTAGLLAGQSTIDPNNGFTSQALGHRAVLDWLHLQPPWWNPYEAAGAPLAGGMQSAALFPPTVLLGFANGQLYEHVLLEIIAGLACFLLLRRIGIGRWASATASVAFALNGTFAWFSHAPVNPVPFLPLLLLGLEETYAASISGRRGGWWLISAAGALSVYAGFPEMAYINALLAVFWFGWRWSCAERQTRRRFVVKTAAGAGAGALLAAPILVAFATYLPDADTGLHAGTAGGLHLPLQAMPQLLLPYVFGPIFAYNDPHGTLVTIWGNVGGYLTTTLVMVAILGLLSTGRRALRLVLACWLVLAVARIFGEPPVLWHVLGLVPGMSSVAFYRYADPSIELAVTVLAALGLDELLRRPGRYARTAWAGFGTLALVAVAAIAAHPLVRALTDAHAHELYARGAVLWGAGVALALTAAAALRTARWRRYVVCSLVVVDVLMMFALPEFSAPRSIRIDLSPVVYLKHHLGLGRYYTLGPIQPNYGAYFGLSSVNENNVPVPSPWAHFVNARLDPYADPLVFVGTLAGPTPASSPEHQLLANLDGYRAAGVGYVLAPAGQALPDSHPGLTLVFRSPTTWIYRLIGAASYFATVGNRCSVTPRGRESVALTCSRPAVLVRREMNLSGWSAEIDGRPANLRTDDGLFQEVNVPAGSHVVSFDYAPRGIGWALIGFAAGAVWFVVGLVRGRRQDGDPLALA